jgi:molybdate transport system substrate-binding protein
MTEHPMATLKLYTSNSMHGVLDDLAPKFERASGHKLSISYDPAKVMLQRIAAGETADLAILGATAIDELAQQGKIDPASRRVLASCGVGIAVRKGQPRPDISSVEALTKTLLAAKSIAFTLNGASGIYFAKVIERLGIADEIRKKAATQAGGLVGLAVAKGDAELAVQQIPELLVVPGVDLVGPLPADVQNTTVVSSGVFIGAAEPRLAHELLQYLCTPESTKIIRAKGLDPAPAAR